VNPIGGPATAEYGEAIPATVAGEIRAECEGPGRNALHHRVWIHRDGSVSAPDHHEDTDAEQVAKALGDQQVNFCHHWLRLNDSAGRSGKFSHGEPHISLATWDFSYESFWTPKSQWTALAGILNSVSFQPMNPKMALAYAQAYTSVKGKLPSRASDHLAWLATPWARQQGGHRRCRATSAAELASLLSVGVPLDEAAAFAALDIDSDIAQEAIQTLRQWSQPPDLFVRLCYALPPQEALDVLVRLPEHRGKRLPSLLTDLASALPQHPGWTEADIGSFLLTD
jgi:hypothetical protein